MVSSATHSKKSLVDRLRACQRANKRCADCPERGPTYICLNFQTFICETCSGIHREFGHKLKSITLSEWSVCEVERVEAGGNERAAQEWMGRSAGREEAAKPDGTDVGFRRELIRQKYTEQRWRVPQPSAGGAAPAQPALPLPPAASASPPGMPLARPRPPAVPVGTSEDATAPPAQIPRALPPPPALQMDMDDILSGEPLDLQPIQLPTPATSQPVQSPGDCCKMLTAEEFADPWTADFSCLDGCNEAPEGSTASTTASKASFDGDDWLWDMSEAPASPQQLQESDGGTTGTNLPTGELAGNREEPRPSSEGLGGQDCRLAEHLREAVLCGNSHQVTQLFLRCLEPKVLPKRELPPDHYTAFDELITPALECSQTPAVPAAEVPPHRTSVGAPTSAQLAPTEPLMPQQATEPLPRGDGAFMPRQLVHMSPQELVRAQGMVEHALTARAQPTSWPAHTRLPDALESSPDEQTPFGDLLLEFHQKNPIAGLKMRG